MEILTKLSQSRWNGNKIYVWAATTLLCIISPGTGRFLVRQADDDDQMHLLYRVVGLMLADVLLVQNLHTAGETPDKGGNMKMNTTVISESLKCHHL